MTHEEKRSRIKEAATTEAVAKYKVSDYSSVVRCHVDGYMKCWDQYNKKPNDCARKPESESNS